MIPYFLVKIFILVWFFHCHFLAAEETKTHPGGYVSVDVEALKPLKDQGVQPAEQSKIETVYVVIDNPSDSIGILGQQETQSQPAAKKPQTEEISLDTMLARLKPQETQNPIVVITASEDKKQVAEVGNDGQTVIKRLEDNKIRHEVVVVPKNFGAELWQATAPEDSNAEQQAAFKHWYYELFQVPNRKAVTMGVTKFSFHLVVYTICWVSVGVDPTIAASVATAMGLRSFLSTTHIKIFDNYYKVFSEKLSERRSKTAEFLTRAGVNTAFTEVFGFLVGELPAVQIHFLAGLNMIGTLASLVRAKTVGHDIAASQWQDFKMFIPGVIFTAFELAGVKFDLFSMGPIVFTSNHAGILLMQLVAIYQMKFKDSAFNPWLTQRLKEAKPIQGMKNMIKGTMKLAGSFCGIVKDKLFSLTKK